MSKPSLNDHMLNILNGLGAAKRGGEVSIQVSTYDFDASGSVFRATLPSIDAARAMYRRLRAGGGRFILTITPLRFPSKHAMGGSYNGMPVIFHGVVA